MILSFIAVILIYCVGWGLGALTDHASGLVVQAMRDRKQNEVLMWLCMLVPCVVVLTICLAAEWISL